MLKLVSRLMDFIYKYGWQMKKETNMYSRLKHSPEAITIETIISVTKEGSPPSAPPQPNTTPITVAPLSREPRGQK